MSKTWVTITVLIAVLISCSSKTPEYPIGAFKRLPITVAVPIELGDAKTYIVEIDSCEYVLVSWGNATWGSHKGNCKYCAMRARNLADSLRH